MLSVFAFLNATPTSRQRDLPSSRSTAELAMYEREHDH
jgi:hypothetical protein